MRLSRSTAPALLSAAALAVATLGTGTASAAPAGYAPADSATVHPGVQTYTEGGQCTANFVFTAPAATGTGTRTFLGEAAHCAGTGEATDTDGCQAGSLPLGTKVEVDGASQPGTLAYSSWIAMADAKEKDAETCAYNDFALIELAPADVAKTNPSVPVFGGPVALGAGTTFGEEVHSYGNSSLRLGVEQLSPKYGTSLGDSPRGWSTDVYTVTPGVPGRLRVGLPGQRGQRLRHAVHRRAGPARGQQRREQPGQGAGLRAVPRAAGPGPGAR